MKTQEELVASLLRYISPLGSYPTLEGYLYATLEAISAFNSLTARTSRVSLTLVAGTDSYELPEDCIRFIRIQNAVSSTGWAWDPISGKYIPLSADTSKPIYYQEGNFLKVNPAPSYSSAVYLYYAKGHKLDKLTSLYYTNMTDEEARIILLKGAALVHNQIANEVVKEAFTYTMTDETIDRRSYADHMRTLSAQLTADFEKRCTEYIGGMYGFLL